MFEAACICAEHCHSSAVGTAREVRAGFAPGTEIALADDEMFEKVGTAVYSAPEVHAACKPGLLQGGRAYGQQVCAYSVRSGNAGSRMLTVSVMAPWP